MARIKMRKKQCLKHNPLLRCSHPDVFCKKGILRNFAKFTEKHLCLRVSFLNKVARRLATLLKRDSATVVFL